jgi:predicted sugar kinase
MEELRRHGATGNGQSSWGPTGFAFASSQDEARRLADLVQEKVTVSDLDIVVCKGLNHGALVKGEALAAIK